MALRLNLCLGLISISAVPASLAGVALTAPIIEGSRAYTQYQLTETYAALLGQPATAAALQQIVAAIEQRYHEDGYAAPVILLPTEQPVSSTPRLEIYETLSARAEIHGDAGPNAVRLERLAQDIGHDVVLNQTRLRRTLQAMQRLPGISLKSTFEREGDSSNRFVLRLDVGYRAVGSSFEFSNRGTQDVGRNLVSGRVSLAGLLHAQETFWLDGLTSTQFDRFHSLGLGMSRWFGPDRVSLYATRSDAELLDFDTRYDRTTIGLHQRLTLSEQEHFAFGFTSGITALNSGSFDDYGVLSEERERKIDIGIEFSYSGESRTRVAPVLVHGIAGLGASAVRFDGVAPPSPSYTALLLDIDHSRPLIAGLQAQIRVRGQYSGDELPYGERFFYGGYTFGRAFEPAALTGDSGIAASLELRRPLKWSPGWLDKAVPFGVLDYGMAWNASDRRFNHDQASSLSTGVLLSRGAWLGLFELSKPLKTPRDGPLGSTLRPYLRMQTSF
jgi:hemolysin activation/secretion protein